MLIGTAGHIDHGKTSLLKALTGQDADRLPQEKQQGITLDLGYAYWPLDDGQVLGFIDVPGHERLLHNMLAGATGIDLGLLVIAADDGPMPQTREHLEILELLGIRQLVIALNKMDAVTPERLKAARQEIHALIAESRFSHAESPVFPLSARTGEGVARLQKHLFKLAKSSSGKQTRSGAGFRLAIDRSFSLTGIGTVVTGTIHSGQVRTGDQLRIAPLGLPARVQSLRVQDRPAESGQAGQRCALVLRGDFGHKDLRRGLWLIDSDLELPVERFQARVLVPKRQEALHQQQLVHLHSGTDDIMARVSPLSDREILPGESGLVEVILERPTQLLHGDHFILRDASARHTVAGGQVLDIDPPTRYKRSAKRLTLLGALAKAVANSDPAAALEALADASPLGLDLRHFRLSWNLGQTEAERLWQTSGLRLFRSTKEDQGITRDHLNALQQRLLATLTAEHERAPDMPGLEPNRLRRLLSPRLSSLIYDSLIEELLAQGRVQRSRHWLQLPEHRLSLSEEDRALFERVKPLLNTQPYNPPRVRDLADMLQVPEYEMRRHCKRLARAGELYPVAKDHYFTAETVAELAAIIRRFNEEAGGARVAAMRDLLFPEGGGGRKIVVRILEFFNRIGYTRRLGDDHLLRDGVTQVSW